jgi:hypothetical protein
MSDGLVNQKSSTSVVALLLQLSPGQKEYWTRMTRKREAGTRCMYLDGEQDLGAYYRPELPGGCGDAVTGGLVVGPVHHRGDDVGRRIPPEILWNGLTVTQKKNRDNRDLKEEGKSVQEDVRRWNLSRAKLPTDEDNETHANQVGLADGQQEEEEGCGRKADPLERRQTHPVDEGHRTQVARQGDRLRYKLNR